MLTLTQICQDATHFSRKSRTSIALDTLHSAADRGLRIFTGFLGETLESETCIKVSLTTTANVSSRFQFSRMRPHFARVLADRLGLRRGFTNE